MTKRERERREKIEKRSMDREKGERRDRKEREWVGEKELVLRDHLKIFNIHNSSVGRFIFMLPKF